MWEHTGSRRYLNFLLSSSWGQTGRCQVHNTKYKSTQFRVNFYTNWKVFEKYENILLTKVSSYKTSQFGQIFVKNSAMCRVMFFCPPVQLFLTDLPVSNQTKSSPSSYFIFHSRTLFVKLWTNLSWAIYDSLPAPSLSLFQPPKGLPAVVSAPNAVRALFPKNPQIRDSLLSRLLKGLLLFGCLHGGCTYMQPLPNKVFIMGAWIYLLLQRYTSQILIE